MKDTTVEAEMDVIELHTADSDNPIIVSDDEKLSENSASNRSALEQYDPNEITGIGAACAKSMARNPCIYLWTCLILSIGLSAIAMIVGEFTVSSNTGGWQSRGTLISDRQTQLMLTRFNQRDLHSGGDEVWNDFLNNVQSGWEDDDDDDDDAADDTTRRQLFLEGPVLEAESLADYLRPKADRLFLERQHAQSLPFALTPALERRQLQVEGFFDTCDVSWYLNPTKLYGDAHLWPVWKTVDPNTSLLDPESLQDICAAEENTQKILEEKNLCFGCEEGCLPPLSIVLYARLAIEDGFDLNCADLATAWAPLQEETTAAWKQCATDIKNADELSVGDLPDSCPENFSPSFVDNAFDTEGKLTFTSSIFATSIVDHDEMFEIADQFDRGRGTVEGAYDTQVESFVQRFVDTAIPSDMALALASAGVVAIAIIVHSKSPLITCIGLLQIILSFPLAYFVYRLVIGLVFFPFLNFIGVFVVFALGAGDIFVAVDKWKNARLDFPTASTEYVAAVALPNAASAMFLTTITTALAFFATAICPVAPIQMFAIWCGLLIIFDYLMNVLLVFPTLCIYDQRIMAKGVGGVSCCITFASFPCCRPKSTEEDVDEKDVEDESDGLGATEKEDNSSSDMNVKPSLIRRILTSYYDFLHKGRWPILLLSLASLGVTIYYASTLALPTSSDVRLLDESNHFETNYVWRQNLVSTTLEKAVGSDAYAIWGVVPADTGTRNDPGSWSQLVLDDTFDASSEEAQNYLNNFCTKLFENEFAAPPFDDYECPMQRFDSWLSEQATNSTPSEGYVDNCAGATAVPVPQDQFDACMTAWSQEQGQTNVLTYEGKIRIIFSPFATRVRFDDQYDLQDREWNSIENYMQSENKLAPKGVNSGYFSSFDFWWYDTNGQMLTTAYSAAAIALGCAAAVILFSSRSVVMTVFSTATIAFILTSVTSILVALGWTLGFLESICFSILIGVSVDFNIHFSHAYATLRGTIDRGTRTKFALIKMGPSILATALTTMLSALVMLFCVITFFQKFALILLFTVVQATLGSFVFFLCLTDTLGPSNPTYVVDRLTGNLEKEKEEPKGAAAVDPMADITVEV